MSSLSRITGYELVRPLGGGPLTQVFAARELESDEACVLKVLRPDWEDQTTAIKLLQREARALLAVKHPHLVRLIQAHVTTTPFYLVMEHLEGETLLARLRRSFRLDIAATIWLCRQIAEALTALHRSGFLHGDVKPDNVCLIKDGKAVLVDLGFAHRVGENAAFLRAGYVLGTANYLAPEVCRQESEGAETSDVFSLGVMLYEMLTGQLPYPPGSVDQIFRRHSCDPPDDIRRLLPELPVSLTKLIERMLARQPLQRPKASEVMGKLLRIEIDGLGRRLAR
jgi:serine/threonine protein kinase